MFRVYGVGLSDRVRVIRFALRGSSVLDNHEEVLFQQIDVLPYTVGIRVKVRVRVD